MSTGLRSRLLPGTGPLAQPRNQTPWLSHFLALGPCPSGLAPLDAIFLLEGLSQVSSMTRPLMRTSLYKGVSDMGPMQPLPWGESRLFGGYVWAGWEVGEEGRSG